MSLCECHECLRMRNGGALRLVELERENVELKKAHDWFVANTEDTYGDTSRCIHCGSSTYEGCGDDCDWVKARDLKL